MEFFFAPMACSLAGRVLIREAGLDPRCVSVSLTTKQTEDGRAFAEISAPAQVPVLVLGDGRVLRENMVVLTHLARLQPGSTLLPPPGTPAEQSALEWLAFTATEVHKLCLYPIFQPGAPDAVKDWALALLPGRLAMAARALQRQPWLNGEHFGAPDAYFGWALSLAQFLGIRLDTLPPLDAYWGRLMQRPAFAQTLQEEGRWFREASA